MKRIAEILTVAMSILAVSSCKKDTPPEPGMMEFSAEVPASRDSLASRTTFNESGLGSQILWAESDRIRINGKQYTLSSGAGSKSGRFKGEKVDKTAQGVYNAIFPYSYASGDSTLTLPSAQNPGTADDDTRGFPMFARSGDESLSFVNICGLLRLNLTFDSSCVSELDGVSVTAGNAPLSGEATIKTSGNTFKAVINDQSSRAGVSWLPRAAVTSLSGTVSVRIYLPEGSYENLSLNFTLNGTASGMSCVKVSKKAVTLTRNKETVITLTSIKPNRHNGHPFVDLGTGDGVMWATVNLGASSAEATGDYYAWAATSTWYSSFTADPFKAVWKDGKSTGYVKGNAPYYDSSSDTYTKYTAGLTLESGEDAAILNWKGKWRIPTKEEMTALKTNCFMVWTKDYSGTGKAGCVVFKAKKDADKGIGRNSFSKAAPSGESYGYSDTHIFLPAGGVFNGTELENYASETRVQTSTAQTDKAMGSISVLESSIEYTDISEIIKGTPRYKGVPVRPVLKQ